MSKIEWHPGGYIYCPDHGRYRVRGRCRGCLVDDYVWIQHTVPNYRVAACRLGVTRDALEQAVVRARREGDRRITDHPIGRQAKV